MPPRSFFLFFGRALATTVQTAPNPVRGGLFIATNAPMIFLLVVRRRGCWNIFGRRAWLELTPPRGHPFCKGRAAERQKEKVRFALGPGLPPATIAATG